uniref:Acylphosphatase-1 n=1 Tax=Ursus americanus TaxID=9643 RepID=A0A452SUL0_URSAM
MRTVGIFYFSSLISFVSLKLFFDCSLFCSLYKHAFALNITDLIDTLVSHQTWFCCAEGKKLGLVGWVQNTDQGTVQGQLQGPISKVRHMQEWLETKGSPKSHIDRANFRNEKVIVKLDYSDFQIVK